MRGSMSDSYLCIPVWAFKSADFGLVIAEPV